MNSEKIRLALKLFDVGAVKFGAFRLKLHDSNPHAPLSPIYIDLRVLRSYPEMMDLVSDVYASLLSELHFDYLADVPTAATPIVTLVCHKLRVPMISPRIAEKAHGTGSKIDGIFQAGKTAIVIDDLITKADSKIKAIQVLEENGLIVRDLVVLVDREQGGILELQKRGYNCHTIFGLGQLLDIYRAHDKISTEQYKISMIYFAECQQ